MLSGLSFPGTCTERKLRLPPVSDRTSPAKLLLWRLSVVRYRPASPRSRVLRLPWPWSPVFPEGRAPRARAGQGAAEVEVQLGLCPVLPCKGEAAQQRGERTIFDKRTT